MPPELALRLLRDAGAGAGITVLADRRIAGVAAAGVRVTPGDPQTSVGAVDVWADPRTGLTLEVDVGGALTTRFLRARVAPPADDVARPRAAASGGFAPVAQPKIASALNLPAGLVPGCRGR
ncbi:hypothetical protein ACQP2P_29845 [Dactylosporangium sp. CA-139114]|uniref:hypothetical protein n=1 Tax=Dactylosporangium sp. CA-139114 TaxID=3239931 RepID=UPI003D95C05F